MDLTERQHEKKEDDEPEKEDEDCDSELQRKQTSAARRIAALLKGEKIEDTAEAELEDCNMNADEEEMDEDYEEGIFIFRANTGACLNCQIPVDEEVYLQNYVHPEAGEVKKEQWEYASKIVVYDRQSLYLFHHQQYFRRLMVNIIENKNFDNFIIFMIFCNSMGMAIYDYSDRGNTCTRNIILE